MKTKSDDTKLLAEAYGKIYAELYDEDDNELADTPGERMRKGYDEDPTPVYVVFDPWGTDVAFDPDSTGSDIIYGVYRTLEMAKKIAAENNMEYVTKNIQ